MATITTLAGAASAGRTAGAVPYLVDVTVDFAAAATAKGSALAAADVIEALSVPANTLILNVSVCHTCILVCTNVIGRNIHHASYLCAHLLYCIYKHHVAW